MTQLTQMPPGHIMIIFTQIQFSAKLGDGRHTDWSAVTSLNAAGTRGCARLSCGNIIHDVSSIM